MNMLLGGTAREALRLYSSVLRKYFMAALRSSRFFATVVIMGRCSESVKG